MKVNELFQTEKIDSDFIEERFDGPYWENCHEFVLNNWGRNVEDLSEKQQDWIKKILDDCTEKRIEG